MTRRKSGTRLDFGTLRLGIERCDAELMLGFYAENARLSIVNADVPQNSPFELNGKAEIAKHLRAAFGQEASHRVEGGVVEEDRVTFREVCGYPDGGRVSVETTLDVRGGKIVRQVDVVSAGTQPDREDEIGPSSPTRQPQSQTHKRAAALSPHRLLRSRQATEKEDL